jgi:hypothetical protein
VVELLRKRSQVRSSHSTNMLLYLYPPCSNTGLFFLLLINLFSLVKKLGWSIFKIITHSPIKYYRNSNKLWLNDVIAIITNLVNFAQSFWSKIVGVDPLMHNHSAVCALYWFDHWFINDNNVGGHIKTTKIAKITPRLFPIEVGRGHFLPLAAILTHTFRFIYFVQLSEFSAL